MLGFLKNKGIGYYIVAVITLLSLIVGIVFFATYKNPDLDPINHINPMGNSSDGVVVETIGIFLIAGAVVELALLIAPQYRFIQIGAIAMFGLALYKDIIIIPDFIAGKANNVEYNGGNYNLNMFFFVMIFIIVIAAIVAPFVGFLKRDEDVAPEMKNVKGTVRLAKLGGAAALVLVAILVSSLVSADLVRKNNAGRQNIKPSDSQEPVPVEPAFDPITDDIKSVAEAYSYDFNPKEVLILEQDEYDFNNSDMKAVPTQNGNRDGHNLVYVFEGAYAEGYQGDYSETYGAIYLWDDGFFGGRINSTDIRGYWYNSSKDAPADDPETVDVDESKDCLNLVSNVNKYEFVNFERASGFYDWRTHLYLGFNWGTRSMEIAGYMYYPEVAIAIDPSSTGTQFKVGETFDRSGWVANRILKNLNYSAVFKASEVTWTDGEGIKNGQAFTAAGEYQVTAKWNGFETSITVTVSE